MALTMFTDPMFSDIERSLSRAFAPMIRGPPGGMMSGPMMPSIHPMDVVEHHDRYAIMADAPGMTPDDIKVELMGDTLVVSGEKRMESKKESEEQGVKMHRHERAFTKFTRSFMLPEDARPDDICASMDNGVLTVNIPKKPEEQKRIETKRIRVGTGASNEPAGAGMTCPVTKGEKKKEGGEA